MHPLRSQVRHVEGLDLVSSHRSLSLPARPVFRSPLPPPACSFLLPHPLCHLLACNHPSPSSIPHTGRLRHARGTLAVLTGCGGSVPRPRVKARRVEQRSYERSDNRTALSKEGHPETQTAPAVPDPPSPHRPCSLCSLAANLSPASSRANKPPLTVELYPYVHHLDFACECAQSHLLPVAA